MTSNTPQKIEIIEIIDSDDESNNVKVKQLNLEAKQEKNKEIFLQKLQKFTELNIMPKQDFYTVGNCSQCFQMGPINSFCGACRKSNNCVFHLDQCITDRNPTYILFITTQNSIWQPKRISEYFKKSNNINDGFMMVMGKRVETLTEITEKKVVKKH